MAGFRFIHAADLHLDSPLHGLEKYPGAPADQVRGSTRLAFENVVELAISNRVRFLIIAGDLFDRQWTDIQTGLWTAQQFRKLESAGIAVYLLRGNHDALSEVPRRMTWPANVHEFGVDAPTTFKIDDIQVALHGQGFATREVPHDLTTAYPDPVPQHYNIGVLHTSLSGDPKHDTYAPTSIENLVLKGYDYWALGHIHQYRELRESPCVIYPGCTQGRHIQEPGGKGCVLVEVDQHNTTTHFHETDSLRWETVEVGAQPDWDLPQLYDAIGEELQTIQQQHAGRYLATRVIVTGASTCYAQLKSTLGTEEAISEVRNIANGLNDVWVEKVKFKVTPLIDVDGLRDRDDLIGEVLREFARIRNGSDEDIRELAKDLEPIGRKAATELRDADIALDEPENIRQWLDDAEAMVISLLTQSGE